MRRSSGLTIVEVLIAAGVLVVIAVGAATLMPAGFFLNNKSKEMAQANQAVGKIMEEMNTLRFVDIKGTASPEPVCTVDSCVPVIDTRNVTAAPEAGPITINGKKYPRQLEVDKKKYRIDILVYKGKHNIVAKLPEPVEAPVPRYAAAEPPPIPSLPSLLESLREYAMPPAQAVATCTITTNPAGEPFYVGNAITFTGNHSGVSGGTQTHSWTFGDGQSASADAATGTSSTAYTYATAQNPYTVTLTVKKNGNNECTIQKTMNIQAANVDIVMTPNDGSGFRNVTSFSFSAANCVGCGTSPTYRWNFGAGEGAEVYGPSVNHVFSSDGSKTVSLNVETGGAPQETATVNIISSTVSITAPVTTAAVGTAFTFEAANCTECGTNPVYTWNFGDLLPGVAGTASPYDPKQTVTHTYAQPGPYTVVLTVNGGSNPQAQRSVTVTATHTANIDVTPGSNGIAGEFTDPETTEFTFPAKSTGFNTSDPITYTYTFNSTVVSNLEIRDQTGTAVSSPVVLVDTDPSDTNYPFVKVKYKVGGSYVVQLRADQISDNALVTTNINVDSRIDFTMSPVSSSENPVLPTTAMTFTAVGKGLGATPQYKWTFGDGNTSGPSASTTATHTFNVAGEYSVLLEAIGGSNPSTTKTILVQEDSTNAAQHVMKKIYLKVSEWSNAPPTDYLGTYIFLKAENE